MKITIKDASEKSGVSQKTIRRHIYAKTLNASKESTSYMIDLKEFNLWAKNLKTHTKTIKTSQIFHSEKGVNQDKSKFVSVKSNWKTDKWSKPNKSGIKFADFFSGAGGLTLGFVKAGFKPVHSVEIMPQAVETYNNNISNKFGDEIVDTRDITDPKVKKEAIKKLNDEGVELIIGGFPCQGFSMAGPRVVDDPRNSLYMHMLEVIKGVMPKVVVMENVTGLRSMLDGKVELKIIDDFQKAGYKISAKTLNSADYFTPQQRKRVIFIANRIDKVNLYPSPLLEKENYIQVKDAISDLLPLTEDGEFNHQFTKHSEDMVKRISKLEEGKSLYKGYSDAWKRVYWDKPSPTVKENHGGVFIHPKVNRVMTARELARLQTFPDDFVFAGSKKWQLVQIGNAVPANMSKAVALCVKKMIKD